MAGISLWWKAVRPFSFTVSIIPPIMGGIIALIENPDLPFNLYRFILTAVGCVLAHAGANLLSDYYDYKARVDRKGTFGSSGLLVEEIMRPRQIFMGGWVALIVAAAIGAYLVLVIPKGLFLIWLILIGAFLGVFYTAGPVEFKYRALGDLAVFISFGPAMVLGAYYVQAHRFSWGPVLYGLPIALFVDAVLHGNNLRDIENDRAVGIKTVPILIGEERAKTMYYGLVFGAYLLTCILILFAALPVFSLITLLSLPLAIKLANMVRHKKEVPPEQFAMIDAVTAQLHLAFGLLMIIAFLLHYFIVM
ncbi:MAG: 1,4-dihydroxy-2-naphthoate octaprenyltransferase [Desulfobacterales bacterium]|nr:1,4-dihydroxy-2-naphthoate octaprenyltransferase [Desulfobacterales bacterium]